MTLFQTPIKQNRRAAARFVAKVHRTLQKAYEAAKAEQGVTQTSIADALGVHRSVICRQLNGREDMSLGRVAEFAWALGCDIHFEFKPRTNSPGSNHRKLIAPASAVGLASKGSGKVYEIKNPSGVTGNATVATPSRVLVDA